MDLPADPGDVQATTLLQWDSSGEGAQDKLAGVRDLCTVPSPQLPAPVLWVFDLSCLCLCLLTLAILAKPGKASRIRSFFTAVNSGEMGVCCLLPVPQAQPGAHPSVLMEGPSYVLLEIQLALRGARLSGAHV